MAKATFLERLEKLDRRWIFLIMFVAIAFPLFVKVELPIRVTAEVRQFYETMEALQPGDIVYYAADFDPGSKPELQPMLNATLDHLCKKQVKIVGACLWPPGPPLLETGFNEIAVADHGYVYGEDFVHLGFKEGKENVMVQLGKSFRAVFPNDYYGTPVTELPLMQTTRNGELTVDNFAGDVKLIINISAGYPGTKEWVQQVRSRYSIAIISGCTAVSAPEYYPYVQSGQLTGLLGGLAGAAEYEKLTGRPGWATVGMSAQSLGHLIIVILIALGNVVYFINHRKQKTE